MRRWTWISSSHIGTSHIKSGQRLQDAYATFALKAGDSEYFGAMLADGAGSAQYGGEGASLVCRVLGQGVKRHIASGGGLPTEADFLVWLDEARSRLATAATKRSTRPGSFASTFLAAVSDGGRTAFIHIGDGCGVARFRSTGDWVAATWPDHGEYASTTYFVTDATLRARYALLESEVDVLALFTDGLERLVLDMATKQPSGNFFQAVSQPVVFSDVTNGRDRRLSEQLHRYLGGSAINARTDDDKTLVIAVAR